MNTLGVPFIWKGFNKHSSEAKILNRIISLCQKEIVMYNSMPLRHGRLEMAREVLEIINKKEK